MKVVKAKINQAQKAFDEAQAELLADHKFAVLSLESKLEADKDALLETHVNSILGKII
jgi:hypothetical protein